MSEHILKFRFRFTENIITQITPNLIYNYIYNCWVFESWIQINIAPLLFLFKVFGFVHICLTQFFFSTFLVNYCGFLNISWKRGIFNFFFFSKRVVWVSRKTHQLPLLCYMCVYIYIAVPIHALWDNLVEQRCLWIKFLFYFWVSLFCGSGFDNCCSNGCC